MFVWRKAQGFLISNSTSHSIVELVWHVSWVLNEKFSIAQKYFIAKFLVYVHKCVKLYLISNMRHRRIFSLDILRSVRVVQPCLRDTFESDIIVNSFLYISCDCLLRGTDISNRSWHPGCLLWFLVLVRLVELSFCPDKYSMQNGEGYEKI